jgi:hypothetical protein
MQRAARLAGLTIGCIAVFLLVAELAFRVMAGDRLLYRADAEIEYLPRPNQSLVQRGVRFETNSWGMRSPAASESKPDGVFRVLVLGDSVVFGHININHADLATTRLSVQTLADDRSIEALNVSAPSWGPGNLLAWIEANGLLGADAAVIVLSSGDLDDDRSFRPPDRDIYPQQQPLFAFGDWAARQLPASSEMRPIDPRSPGDARRSLPALFQRISEAPAGACLLLHTTAEELASPTTSAGLEELSGRAREAAIDVIYTRDFLGASDYIDTVHLSADGQANLAIAMMSCPALADARS